MSLKQHKTSRIHQARSKPGTQSFASFPISHGSGSVRKCPQEFVRRCPTQKKPAQRFHIHTASKTRVVTTTDPIQELLVSAQMMENILLVQQTYSYKPRAEDIILATQPKCGTTWLKALVFTITNRSRYSFSEHPLLSRHPQHVVPFIEIPGFGTDHTDIDTLPSPRILATHMPMSILPPEATSCGCRIVYLCRDPKDALVSRLHYENIVVQGCNLSMDSAFSMFCEGFSPNGPFWDHCLEYWKESLSRPNNVLFLKYEEIMSDLVQAVRKIAEFLGLPLTEEEESSGVAEEVVRLCSFETLTSLQVNQVGGVDRGNKVYLYNSAFFRKGKVGDWVNHMSQEMGEKLDRIVQEKLQGCGLVF